MKLPSRIYHLANADTWSSIRNNGLLCASALLRQSGVVKEDWDRIERNQRREDLVLPNGVRLRDQKPMPPEALERCLVGMMPSEWYALINSKVFFWLDADRLNRQRAACAQRPQVVLEIDTERLVARHADLVALSGINTGNAVVASLYEVALPLYCMEFGMQPAGRPKRKGWELVCLVDLNDRQN